MTKIEERLAELREGTRMYYDPREVELLDLATQLAGLLREAVAFETHHDWSCKSTMGLLAGPCDCGLNDHLTRRKAILDGDKDGDE